MSGKIYNSTRLASQDSNTLEYYTREICNYTSIFREFQKNRTVDLYAVFLLFCMPKEMMWHSIIKN